MPDENLHMILLLMTDNTISRVTVTRDHKLIGIITGHDLLPVSILFGTGTAGRYWTAQEELIARRRAYRFIPSGIKAVFLAKDIMKHDPVTITKGSDLEEAAQIMINNRSMVSDIIVDEDFYLFTLQRFGILVKLLGNPYN